MLGFLLAGFALAGSPGPATLSLAATGAAFGARRGLGYMTVIIIVMDRSTGTAVTNTAPDTWNSQSAGLGIKRIAKVVTYGCMCREGETDQPGER